VSGNAPTAADDLLGDVFQYDQLFTTDMAYYHIPWQSQIKTTFGNN